MDIKFDGNWYGRFGNNIISIINVIALAELTSSKVTFNINHDLLHIENLDINFKKQETDRKISVNPLMCYHLIGDYFINLKEIIYKMHPMIAKKYIRPIIHELKIENIDFNDTLVIHIRGGDIFNAIPHHDYVQPPLQYYERIIDSSGYSNIIILSEDNKNPCIDALIKKYNNIIFKQNILLYDVHIMLNAKYIVASNSTLIYAMLMISTNIKKVYYNSFLPTIELEGVSIFTYDFINYIKYGDWQNTPNQKNLMLHFPHKNIKRIFVKTDSKNIVENMKINNYTKYFKKSHMYIFSCFLCIIFIILFV